MKTIEEYFENPPALKNADDQRIYRLLVESGWLTPPEQEQFELNGSVLFETPLCKFVHRERAKKRRKKQK